MSASTATSIPVAATELTGADRLGALRMRLNIGRNRYRVAPGLYRVGAPSPQSPVLVTANWKFTFDVVRSNLAGLDVWLLVLDTQGINVWCAAGKGTFSTIGLSTLVVESGLAEVVEHRTLVLPQLSAPGVAAHDVKAFTGFRVVYGPVRAADIRAFLAAGMKATDEMRRVTFATAERFKLTGVELSTLWSPKALAACALVALASGVGRWGFSLDAVEARGGVAVGAALLALLAGALVMPVLLPWLPFRAFSAKGAFVGAVFGAAGLALAAPAVGMLAAAAAAIALTALASFIAMNFTGASAITSPSGVEREMRSALPFQLGGGVVAVVAWFASALFGRGW